MTQLINQRKDSVELQRKSQEFQEAKKQEKEDIENAIKLLDGDFPKNSFNCEKDNIRFKVMLRYSHEKRDICTGFLKLLYPGTNETYDLEAKVYMSQSDYERENAFTISEVLKNEFFPTTSAEMSQIQKAAEKETLLDPSNTSLQNELKDKLEEIKIIQEQWHTFLVETFKLVNYTLTGINGLSDLKNDDLARVTKIIDPIDTKDVRGVTPIDPKKIKTDIEIHESEQKKLLAVQMFEKQNKDENGNPRIHIQSVIKELIDSDPTLKDAKKLKEKITETYEVIIDQSTIETILGFLINYGSEQAYPTLATKVKSPDPLPDEAHDDRQIFFPLFVIATVVSTLWFLAEDKPSSKKRRRKQFNTSLQKRGISKKYHY